MFLILLTGLNRLKSGVSFWRLKPNLVTNRWTLERQEDGEPSDDRQGNERALEQHGGDAGKGGDAQVGVKRLGQRDPQHGFHARSSSPGTRRRR